MAEAEKGPGGRQRQCPKRGERERMGEGRAGGVSTGEASSAAIAASLNIIYLD